MKIHFIGINDKKALCGYSKLKKYSSHNWGLVTCKKCLKNKEAFEKLNEEINTNENKRKKKKLEIEAVTDKYFISNWSYLEISDEEYPIFIEDILDLHEKWLIEEKEMIKNE